jgi:pimeloyl-ACP methyl ester carboxylesterase
VVGAAYAAWVALLFFGQRRMIYPRIGLPQVPSALTTVHGARGFWLSTDGGDVEAWFLPPVGVDGPAPALLFTHGNAELIDYWVDDLQHLAERGIGVMLLEFPGYGRSGGAPAYQSIRQAVLSAFDTLAAQDDVDARRIVPFGRSLGGGAAALLTLERDVPALVLHSTFTSLRPFARRFFAPGFMIRDRFENLEAVQRFPGPVLVLHGERDAVIPFWHAQELAAGARDAVLIAVDCGHNDCPPSWPRHVEEMVEFLKRAGVLS